MNTGTTDTQYLPMSKRFSTPGNPDIKYGPFDSMDKFWEFLENNGIDLTPSVTVSILQSNGKYKEYWNNDSSNLENFTEKNIASAQPSASNAGCAVYMIELDRYNITEGVMTKNSSGHFTADQYTKMRNNGIGISQAIVDAKEAGYSKVMLPFGTYCLGFRSAIQKFSWGNISKGIPSIIISDVNNMEFDLNGSTIMMCIDSSQKSQYYKEVNASASYHQQGDSLLVSYCNDFIIFNGKFIGDRLMRSYTVEDESDEEQTYGIHIGHGCHNLQINNCRFEGYMGDGVSGTGFVYYSGIETDETNLTKYNEANYIVLPAAKRENTWKATADANRPGMATQTGSCDATIVTSFIDTNNLYKDTKGLKNRLNDKNNKRFHLFNTPGQSKMVNCYPFNIGIITYASNADGATPLRYFECAFQQPFFLSENERYIRIQLSHEPNVADEYVSTKSYSVNDVVSKHADNVIFQYRCIDRTSGNFNGTKWERLNVIGADIAENYSTSKEYLPGDIVTHSIGEGYVGYTCKSATTGTFDSSKWTLVNSDTPFRPSFTANLSIAEYTTYGVFVNNCTFENCHRGNMSNMPNDTIVTDCTFYKHWKTPDDGFPVPNPGSNMACTKMPWATIYNIDLEDYYASNVKFIRCRFGRNGSGGGKILLGCMSVSFDNCWGEMPLTLYTMSSLFVNNCESYKFGLDFLSFNPSALETGARFLTRDVFVTNNKLVTNSFGNVFHTKGSNIVISGNSITTYSTTGNASMYANNVSANYVFSNNFVTYVRRGDTVDEGFNARVFTGNNINTYSKVNISTPFYGYGSSINSKTVCIGQAYGKIDVKDINIASNQCKIAVVESSDHKSVYKFKNISLDLSDQWSSNIIFSSYDNSRTSGQIIDVYFENCSITAKCASGNAGICSGERLNGDKIRFHFINVDFDTTIDKFVAGSSVSDIFSCVECKDCTFSKDLYIGSVKITNS